MLSLISMGGKKDAEALNFGEPALAQQLDAGARALEFDIAYDPQGGLFKNPAGASMAGELLDPAYVTAMSQPGFKVIHVLDIDFRSNCLTLKDCLTEVVAWSRTHPRSSAHLDRAAYQRQQDAHARRHQADAVRRWRFRAIGP